MRYPQLTVRLDHETLRRLEVIATNENRSRGQVIRNAIIRHYGIRPPGRPNADAPWLNGERGADG